MAVRSSLRKNKRKAYVFGYLAEYIAILILIIKGYSILKHRYRTPFGEIDLIAKRFGTVVFIEVKARKGDDALESISKAQRERIINASSLFIAKKRKLSHYTQRFDVITIKPWHMPHHIKDAWRPGLN